jgi:hypothetical protein
MRSPRLAAVLGSAVASLLAVWGAGGMAGCSKDKPGPGDTPDSSVPVVDAMAVPDAAPDAPPPPDPPFAWVGVIGTGQSLSVGATSTPLTKTQPFHNLKLVDTGPDPKYPIGAGGAPIWAATPLVEPFRTHVTGTGPGYADGQYPNSVGGESPQSGMANALTALWTAHGGGGEYVTAHSNVGWSGHCLTDINKAGGKRAYPASLHEASVFQGLAQAAGKTFGYGGIILTHGECDGGNARYGAGLFTLWQDYNTDLKAITGQPQDVVLLVSQQSTIGAGNYANSAVQVWQAGVAHPGQVVCTGPKYQYAYSTTDNLHFQAPGYVRMGEKYAEVFDLIVNQGVAWKPLQPSRIDRAGAVLTIVLDVPNPPLAWDEHLAKPHQTTNTAWANGRGFEVKDAAGAPLTISDATIAGSTVVLTLAAAPVGKITVAYAITQDGTGLQGGTALGMHGQLRDSDELIAYDAELIDATVTAGSPVVTSTTAGAFAQRAAHDLVVVADSLPADTIVSSFDSASQLTLSAPWAGATGTAKLAIHHDLHNYCVHFAMDVP